MIRNFQAITSELVTKFRMRKHRAKKIQKIYGDTYEINLKIKKWYQHVEDFVIHIALLLDKKYRIPRDFYMGLMYDMYKKLFNLNIIVNPESFIGFDTNINPLIVIPEFEKIERYELSSHLYSALFIYYALKDFNKDFSIEIDSDSNLENFIAEVDYSVKNTILINSHHRPSFGIKNGSIMIW